MPALSSGDLTRLRTTIHATKLYVGVYKPATIWTALVSGAQAQGAMAITVASVVQVRAPQTHYRVNVGTTAGAWDLGTARFKSYASGTLNVGAHNATLPNGAYLSIIEEIKPETILPRVLAGGTTYEDYDIAYSDQNTKYAPLCRMGPPAVAFRDAGGNAVIYSWDNSVAVADGATLASSSWNFQDAGTSSAFGTAGSPVATTFTSAGARYVAHTVTDSNGKAHARYTPYFIFDHPLIGPGGGVPYELAALSQVQGDVDRGGWEGTLVARGTADTTQFPPEALVVVFAEDWYGAEKVSIGGDYTYRENIVFVGYIREGTAKTNWFADATRGAVEFKVAGIGCKMDNLLAWPANMKDVAVPSAWHQLQGLTCDRAVYHILTEHSTVDHITDIDLGAPVKSLKYVDVTESVLHDQCETQVLTAVRARLGSSRTGRLYSRANSQLMAAADRPATPVLTSILADLRGEMDMGVERQEKVDAQIDFVGFGYNGSDISPIYALAPAQQWPTGKVERVDGIRADSQSEANILSGLFEGWKNNSFDSVTVNWRGNYRVFDPYPAEPLLLNLPASKNNRGITWTNVTFWHKRATLEYKPGVLLASSVLDMDVVGNPGITGPYPVTPPAIPPPTPPPVIPPIEPPPTIGPNNVPGKGNLFYVTTHKGLAKCVGAYSGTPVWSSMNGSGGGALGNVTIRWFNLDPFSGVGGQFTAGWAMTDGGLYRVTGLPAAPVWTLQLTATQASTLIGQTAQLEYRFTPSVRKAGYLAVIATYYVGIIYPGDNVWRHHLLYSNDYGATWQVNTSYSLCSNDDGNSGSLPIRSPLYPLVSQHLNDVIYASIHGDARKGDSSRYATMPFIWKSVTLDGNWVELIALGDQFPYISGANNDIYIPFCNNTGVVYTDDLVKYVLERDLGAQNAIIRYKSESPAWNDTNSSHPTAETIGDAAMPNLNFLFSNMFNEDYGIALDSGSLWFSQNMSQAAPTWTRKTQATLPRLTAPRYQFCVPADEQLVFVCGAAGSGGVGSVIHTTNFGATWVDDSLDGQAGSLTNVMGLGAGDMDDSTIFVDYLQV